ncbi:MAG: D-alanyl-D-alanine carboxypeptidase family protein [Paracoccaceae bacterium]
MVSLVFCAGVASAAPYAALVMDARTGEVLHSRNADTKLHPASLTKMMTLYIVFHEVEAGRMSLDQKITISRNAASEPPSKLGLRSGQKIALRYLIRAAAVKSANDAATALGEAVSGSEAAFAKYMTATARVMGMSNTTFKNAHGLTASGHVSTARDMATLGRRLFYDFPDYYNLFSRITTNTSLKTVYNTNRRFLSAYRGADGIKTGYTNAAGFNLVASARRGEERIIAAMFGGTSTAQRNGQVAKLLDMGFDRAPTRVATIRPAALNLSKPGGPVIRMTGFVKRTDRPIMRGSNVASPSSVLMARNIDSLVTSLVADTNDAELQKILASLNVQDGGVTVPIRRPASLRVSVKVATIAPLPTINLTPAQEFGDWAIELGNYANRTNTEKLLLKTALMDLDALQGADRKVEVTVVHGVTMFRARFVGLSETDAYKACSRLVARDSTCQVVSPS